MSKSAEIETRDKEQVIQTARLNIFEEKKQLDSANDKLTAAADDLEVKMTLLTAASEQEKGMKSKLTEVQDEMAKVVTELQGTNAVKEMVEKDIADAESAWSVAMAVRTKVKLELLSIVQLTLEVVLEPVNNIIKQLDPDVFEAPNTQEIVSKVDSLKQLCQDHEKDLAAVTLQDDHLTLPNEPKEAYAVQLPALTESIAEYNAATKSVAKGLPDLCAGPLSNDAQVYVENITLAIGDLQNTKVWGGKVSSPKEIVETTLKQLQDIKAELSQWTPLAEDDARSGKAKGMDAYAFMNKHFKDAKFSENLPQLLAHVE